jgi:hypothetical protein
MKPKRQIHETAKGAEIPIPKRDDFFKNLKKAAAPLVIYVGAIRQKHIGKGAPILVEAVS